VKGALLDVRDLVVHFRVPDGVVRAVDGVSFAVGRGEALGLVGESGSGKTTTGRAVLLLERPTAGTVRFDGTDLGALGAEELRRLRRRMTIVFQDPYGSLDPRMTVGDIVAEPLVTHRTVQGSAAVAARVQELLDRVGLSRRFVRRYPHEFSGGQRQRVGIARALACGPDLIVCDEPVSALDVSIQAQIVNLLSDLQAELRVSYLFIAHDLAVVRHLCRRVAVMYLGRIVEIGTREQVFEAPAHPYTRALLSAVPVPDPDKERARTRTLLVGEIPSPLHPPSGCAFHTRCPVARPSCAVDRPVLEPAGAEGHLAACPLRS
jgi:oligopeptide/dipeptide ABC transporter ATP-binding protein